MRSGAGQQEKAADKRLSIPITVRQLEAVIRISESLAKIRLQPFVADDHVNEALRLFQVSTLDAAMTGSLAGAEGFTTEEDQETLNRIEKLVEKVAPIAVYTSGKGSSAAGLTASVMKDPQTVRKLLFNMVLFTNL